jgi:hypothetical protein
MGFSEFENRRIEKTVNAFLEKRRPPSDLRKKLDLWEVGGGILGKWGERQAGGMDAQHCGGEQALC